MSDYPYGLDWEVDYFGCIVPLWTVEPDTTVIAAIVSKELKYHVDVSQVTFADEGSYNKVYKVVTPWKVYAMRLTLPIDVPYKVQTEVDTMNFLAETVSNDPDL